MKIGLSDFHVMIATALKRSFQKRGPNVITYRDCNKFNNLAFKAELLEELASNLENNTVFIDFNKIMKIVLDKHTLCKKKYV